MMGSPEAVHSFNPFPGLRPFDSSENYLFFGRDGQSNELLRKLRKNHFLAVVGTSGSGKSSLVRAGLLPDLYSGMMAGSTTKWRVAIFRPGGNPVENMARALSQPGVLVETDAEEERFTQEQFIRVTLGRSALGLIEAFLQAQPSEGENLLVVVDQFEELFRFIKDSAQPNARDQAVAFVKLLLASVREKSSSIYVVITMRSDYLGDCSRFRDLPEAINLGQYLIPRMTRNQRRQAICGPVAVGGATISPQLVQLVLNDVGSSPDQLPIMQHTLMRTWDNWREQGHADKPIDISDYMAVGGIKQALSLHADKAYNEVITGFSNEESASRKKTVEKLFKFLTEKGPDNREIRRQASLSDIVEHTQADYNQLVSVVEVFRKPGYSFLMPLKEELSPNTLIDISHESLIRQWETLKKWVDEEAESSEIFLRLVESARQYFDNKKDLLFGLELDQYIEWKEKFKPDVAWAKRYSKECDKCLKYLEDSQQQRKKIEKQKLILAAERELKRRKELWRARIFALVLALTTLVSIGFLVYAFQQKRIADQQREHALEQRDIAQANYRISEAQLYAESDPTMALRIAELATKIRRSPLVLNAAHKIYRENIFYKTLPHQSEVYAVAFSPDGELMVTGSNSGTVRIWNYSAEVVLEISASQQGINAVAFAPTKDKILTGAVNGTAALYDLEGNLLQEFKHNQPVTSIGFTPDGNHILTGSETARLWDLRGNLVRTFGQSQVSSVTASPDGRSVLTAYYDKNAELWDINGKSKRQFGGDADYIYSVAFAADGSKIVTGSVDGIAKVWDLGGNLLSEFEGHTNRISSLAFSPNGNKLVTGSFDNEIGLWDLKEGQHARLKGHTNRISSVSFSPDGLSILSGSLDGTARYWKQQGQLIREFEAHDEYILSVAYSPDGSKLFTGSYDQTARTWDLNGKLLAEIAEHSSQVNSVAFSPDGSKLLTGSEDGIARLTDLNGAGLQEFKNHGGAVTSVGFSPDGSRIITASADSMVRCWSLDGKLIHTVGTHRHRVSSVAYAPDGKLILAASWDSLASLWNEEGELLATYSGHKNQVHSAVFSHDGSRILTGSGDGSMIMWDLEGQILLEVKDHPGIVSSVAFSPDDSKILSVTLGHSARLWDLEGNLLKEYPGQMVSAAFSADGSQILTGSGEVVQLWDGAIKLDEFLNSGRIDQLNPDLVSD